MHPDLSPHLHTDECNTFTSEFRDCNLEVRDCHYKNYILMSIIGQIYISLIFSAQLFKISWKM